MNNPKTIILVVAAILVVGLIGALVLGVWLSGVLTKTGQLAVPSSSVPVSTPWASQNQSSQITPPSSTNYSFPSNSSTDASALLEAQWALITNGRVQQACLSQAKAAAVAQGYDSAMVFGCGCQALESSQKKSYSCQVSALDGQHPVSIICTKNSQSCQIDSQQGNAVYTFDELTALVNS